VSRRAALGALEAEAAALVSSLRDRPEDEFDRPTRCEPWTVRELLAHVLVACDRLPAMLAEEEPAGPTVTAHGYFTRDKRFSAEANATRVVNAQRDAREFADGRSLVKAVGDAVRGMVMVSAAEPEERAVRTRWDDRMLLTDFLETRVTELAIHGMDLAAALDVDSWLTDEAAAITVAVLTEGIPPDTWRAFAWDHITLIEKVTGRQPLTDDERAALADLPLPTMS
jgi:uncharacterized protein (TIGR03083 family)